VTGLSAALRTHDIKPRFDDAAAAAIALQGDPQGEARSAE